MKNQKTLQVFRGVAIAALLCSGLTAVHAQSVNLQLQNDYTNQGAAYAPSIAVGDVNNDGWPDLVATNRPTAGGDFIAVYLNNGAGGFSSAIPAGLNFSARVVVLGDFNKDGNLDLAIGRDTLATGLNIRLGNGTGNFPTGTDFGSTTTIESISDMVAADFNGDNTLDLAITKVGGYNTAPSNAVKLLLGNGLGSFGAPTAFAVQFGGAQDLEVSDFNVDGRPDIAATAPNSNVIQVLLNNGGGDFSAPVNTTSSGARKIISGDFNRDCIPDLAISINTSNVLTVRLGNGAGGFGAPSSIVLNHLQEGALAVADFNRDRIVDIAVRHINGDANNFTVLSGNGAGGFQAGLHMTLPLSDSAATSLAVMDANLDGKSDIVINRQGGFALYHGNSTLFTRTENDFDGDLRTDISAFRPSNGNWYINRTTLGYSQKQFGLGSDKPAAADYDGDGKTDIAIWRPGAPFAAAFWILQSSNNTVRIEQFGQTGDDSTVVADWDGDGKADPAVYRNAAVGSQSYFFYRGSINSNGNTTYAPWGTDLDKPVRGDFDGDGKADLAVFRPSNLVWYVMQSSNGQIRYQSWGLGTDRRVPGDYDGDGKTDFAVFRQAVDNNWYILSSATGQLIVSKWGQPNDQPTPGDYNGDGKTEVAVWRPNEGNWYIPRCANYNVYRSTFGTNGDTAIPSAFVP